MIITDTADEDFVSNSPQMAPTRAARMLKHLGELFLLTLH